jgi:uncharacterized RDD family membrane protein YckC
MEIQYYIRRFLAFYTDAFITVILTFILVWFFSLVNLEPSKMNPVVYQIVIFLFYFTICEYFFETTIAKFFFGLKVVFLNESKENFILVLFRTISRFIPLDTISILFNSDALMWHDKLSKSKVIITNSNKI